MNAQRGRGVPPCKGFKARREHWFRARQTRRVLGSASRPGQPCSTHLVNRQPHAAPEHVNLGVA